MKSLKVFLLTTAVTVAYLPISAGAFGFGASKYKYPPAPAGAYGPYGGYPAQAPPAQGSAAPNARPQAPYAPPPNARNVQGMWGSGPGMSWGSPDRDAWYKEVEERRKRQWKWTNDWAYESPYKDAKPWVSPFDTPPAKVPPE